MIRFRIGGLPIRVSFWFPVMILAMLWWGDETFTLQCLAASLLHECGHFAVMSAVHDVPKRVCFGVFGVRVERNEGSVTGYLSQAAVSVGGPLGNVVCAMLLYVCCGRCDGVWIHLTLGLFNLLPVEGLDGGEALYRLLCSFINERCAHRFVRWLSVMILLPVTSLGFFLLFQSGSNVSLMILSLYLIFLLIFKEKH